MHGAGSQGNTEKFVKNTKKMATTNSAEILPVMLSLFAGLLFGTVFFGGLWWTVTQGVASKRPVLLFVTSFFFRATFAVSGLYAVGHAHLERLSASLLGFFAVRFFILHLTRPSAKQKHD